MARPKRDIKLRFRYAVLGDGRTEQFYLKHLKTLKGYGYTIKPSLFNSITLSQAEEIIDDLLKGGCDKIVFITDYDTIVNQNQKQVFSKFVKKYRKRTEVIICETMPSIEFWFLLHYQYTTRAFQNAKEVEEVLKKHMPEYSKNQEYLKNEQWVQKLCAEGKLDIAISNAEKSVDQMKIDDSGSHHPYSKVHMSIKEFEKMKGGKR